MHHLSQSLKPHINLIYVPPEYYLRKSYQAHFSPHTKQNCTFLDPLCPIAVDIFSGFDLVVHQLTVMHMSAIFKTHISVSNKIYHQHMTKLFNLKIRKMLSILQM